MHSVGLKGLKHKANEHSAYMNAIKNICLQLYDGFRMVWTGVQKYKSWKKWKDHIKYSNGTAMT